MSKSDSIKELAVALAKAQSKMDGAKKDKSNPHFKSKYADLSSVTEAVAAIHEQGLSYIQVAHDREHAAAIETIILHSSGEWMSCGVISVPVSKHDAHGFGSALTYARRYSLSAAFGVAPEDDDGNAAASAKPEAFGPAAKRVEKNGPQGKYMAEQYTDKPWSAGDAIWDSLPPDMQVFLTDLAGNVSKMLAKGQAKDALDEIEFNKLGEDDKACLWTRFNKDEKKALQAEAEARKERKAA